MTTAVVCAALVAAIAAGAYLVLAARVRFEWWRALSFVAGAALFVATVAAVPDQWPRARWLGGGAIGVATTYVSFLLVLGDPVALLRRAGIGGELWDRLERNRVVNFLVHPLVAGPLNCVLLVAIFGLGWYDHAKSGGFAWLGLMALVTLGGVLTDAGLLIPELLRNVSPGARLLYSVIDGLLDEFPGLIVIQIHPPLVIGGSMWFVVQPVVIPLLLILLSRWVRRDLELARSIDAELDALERDQA